MRPNIGSHFHGNFCRFLLFFFHKSETKKKKNFIFHLNFDLKMKWQLSLFFSNIYISTFNSYSKCVVIHLSIEYSPPRLIQCEGCSDSNLWMSRGINKIRSNKHRRGVNMRRWWIICRVPQPHRVVITKLIRKNICGDVACGRDTIQSQNAFMHFRYYTRDQATTKL